MGVYHEKQTLLYCALHAVNGILGRREFSVQDFNKICEKLDSRWWFNSHRLPLLGNYDVNVITIALEKAGCLVKWHDHRLGKKGLSTDATELVGYIVNVKRFSWFWWGKHWLGIRKAEDGSFWCVDSSLRKPYRFKGPDDVKDFVKDAQDSNGQVLIVTRKTDTS